MADVLSGTKITEADILLATTRFLALANARFWAGVRARPRPVTVVAVAEEDDPTAETELLYLGCAGVLKADAPAAEIERALYAVSAGELWFPRMSLSEAIRALLPAPAERRLTPRERQILQMIGQGRNNREIAQALFISRETVRWHVRSLNSKFGVHDRRQVASLALGDAAASGA